MALVLFDQRLPLRQQRRDLAVYSDDPFPQNIEGVPVGVHARDDSTVSR